MAQAERYTVEQVAEALQASGGIKTLAGLKLGCSHTTINNYIKKYPQLAEVQDAANEQTLDVAEGNLLKQIQDGNLTAIIFYLKTKGKHRGYNERHEHVGENGGPVQHQGDINVRFVDVDQGGG